MKYGGSEDFDAVKVIPAFNMRYLGSGSKSASN